MSRRSRSNTAQVARHVADVRRVAGSLSTLKKLLMTCMVVGTMGTAVGAGTFASYTARANNATATFATGTLVLSDQVGTATACLSTGGGTTTDDNNNANCDLFFDADAADGLSSYKRPGESNSVAMHLKNNGSLASSLSVQSAADCTDEDPADQPGPPYGTTGTGCETVQMSLQESGTCWWGDNMGTSTTKPFITGAPLTFPVKIRSIKDSVTNEPANNLFKITVDGTAHDNVTIAGTPTYEKQHIAFTGTPSGTFTLSFGGATTSAITYSSTAATMVSNLQTALNGLSTVGVGGSVVATTAANNFDITFAGANTGDLAQMTNTAPAAGTLTITTVTTGVGYVSYANVGALITAIQAGQANGAGAALSTYANVTAVGTGIKIESKTATGSSNVTLNIPATLGSTALTAIGFMDGSSAAGPGICAVKTGDRDHSLADFRTNGVLQLGAAGASVTRDFTITLSVPSVIADLEQARKTNFELTWTIV